LFINALHHPQCLINSYGKRINTLGYFEHGYVLATVRSLTLDAVNPASLSGLLRLPSAPSDSPCHFSFPKLSL
jgi:hypothetical protein